MSAQPIRTAVVQPSGEDQQLSGALERVIRTRLNELGVGGELESSPLAWGDLELASGCMGEDAECYAEVATQLGVDELVLATADGEGDECVVELVRWHDGGVERRLLHARGDDARFEILSGVGPALRAMYGLPPEAPSAPRVARRRGPDVAGPVTVAVASLGALGGGLALTFASDASRTAWQAGGTTTMRDVDATLAARQRAEREMIAADVLFATAAVGAVVATVWLIAELTGGDGNREVARGLDSQRWSF